MRKRLLLGACLACWLAVCIIGGCGQQGPLYLPEDSSESSPPPQKQVDQSKSKQTSETSPESVDGVKSP